jgi:hypothetical protein
MNAHIRETYEAITEGRAPRALEWTRCVSFWEEVADEVEPESGGRLAVHLNGHRQVFRRQRDGLVSLEDIEHARHLLASTTPATALRSFPGDVPLVLLGAGHGKSAAAESLAERIRAHHSVLAHRLRIGSSDWSRESLDLDPAVADDATLASWCALAFTPNDQVLGLIDRTTGRHMQPDAYTGALNLLGASAAEAFFVDDSPANVAGARNLGITAVVFTDAESLERDLTAARLLS